MTEIESALINSANGDTNTLLVILFIIGALGIISILLNFILKKLPSEMQLDRESNCTQVKELTDEIKKLTEVMSRLLEVNLRIENNICKK